MDNNSFYSNYRKDAYDEAVRKTDEEAQKKQDDADIASFGKRAKDYAGQYSKWAKENGGKYADSDAEAIVQRLWNIARRGGQLDGSLTSDSSDADVARYGNKLLNEMMGLNENGNEYSVFEYTEKYGSDEARQSLRRKEARRLINEALKRNNSRLNVDDAPVRELEDIMNKLKKQYKWMDGLTTGDVSHDGWRTKVYSEEDKKQAENWEMQMSNAMGEWRKKNTADAYNLFDEFEKYADKKSEEAPNDKKGSDSASSDDDEYVEFMLTKGNDPNYRGFGQKILDLGINTDNGLWGENGDVAYYTKQLNDQGIYGNLPINQTIRLKRRK